MSFFTQASFVMDPNVYGDGKLYVPKPTDGSGDLTFTRSTSGTRVNQAGLIEKVRTNLILQSNSFDTTWATYDTSVTAGQADKDGGTDAWLLAITGATGFQTLRQTLSVSGINTFSIYAKAGALNWMRINTGVSSTYFNISTGAVGTDSSLGASIEAVGNGYYRCVVPFSGTATFVFIYPATGDNNPNQTSGNIYIQNAQLETGDIATDYIPTTTSAVTVGPVANLPRLNYGADGCPSLLLEPQRTNLYPYSEQLNQWTPTAGLTVTANYAVSPDGYQNADRVQFSGDTNMVYYSGTGSAGENTLSVYAKATNGTSAKFRFFANGATTYSSDQTATGEWQRFTFTYTYSAQTAGLRGATTGASDVIFWGFQHEIGSYATSYIPTLGAAVTRGNDVCEKTGITSLIGQTEGTFYTDFTREGVSGLANTALVNLNDGSNANRLRILSTAGVGLRILFQLNGNIVQYDASTGSPQISTIDQQVKIAIAYKSGDIAVYINGQLFNASTNTLTISAPLSKYELTDGSTGFIINQALLFKTRLSNADLAKLTSL